MGRWHSSMVPALCSGWAHVRRLACIGTGQVALLALGVKGLTFFFGWLAYILIPQEARVTPPDPHLGVEWLRIWAQWDVEHYLRVSEQGYVLGHADETFFPVLPLTMRMLGALVGNNFLAGVILGNAAMVLAAVLLYRLSLLLGADHRTAGRASFYLLIFPAAFFTSTAYSEGLYLAFCIGSFYALERGHWIVAGLVGGLAAATRVLGALILAPFSFAWLLRMIKTRRVDGSLLLIPLTLLGLAGAVLFYWQQLGDPLAFVHAQTAVWGRHLEPPWSTLWQGWRGVQWETIYPEYRENYTTNALNFAAGILFLVLSVASFRLGPVYGSYALLTVLLPMLSTGGGDRPLAALIRYVLPAFPCFIVLAGWGRNRVVDRLITVTFVLFYALLTALFLRSWNIAGVS